jgi:dipeptidyl aminopeptidase/acylaminoacyl peptidase
MLKRFVLVVALAALLVPAALLAQAQAPAAAPQKAAAPVRWADEVLKKEGYATPPPELAPAVTAPRDQNIALSSPSPDKKWFLNEIGDGPVLMATFSKPFHELGGLFIDYKANRARPLTVRNNIGIQIISAADGSKKPIALPAGARVSNAAWSPDSKLIAFFLHTDDATHIWVADIATGAARPLTTKPVLATLNSGFDFSEDGRTIATVLVPDARAAMPVAPVAPSGPSVKLAEDSDKNRLRTFPSLMTTPYDFQLLEWHATGQVALIDVVAPVAPPAKGKAPKLVPAPVKKVGAPAMVRSLDLSPDGKYVRLTRMVKPFSYVVPVSNFGTVDEIWDIDGKLMVELDKRPLNEGVADDTQPAPDPAAGPGGGAGQQQGRRELAWRADGQGLTYLEQEPAPAGAAGAAGRAGAGRAGGGRAAGGDQAAGAGRGQAPARPDRVYQWLPPFAEKGAKAIFENTTRMNGVRYSPDMQTIFFRETSGQNTVEVAVSLKEPAVRNILARFRADDPAANPGTLVSTRGGGGGGRGGGGGGRGGAGGGSGPVLMSPDNTSVYYQGTLNDKEPEKVGPKTFLDKVAIKNGEKKRLFESDNKDVYESIATVVDPEAGRFILERQSPTQPPQYYAVDATGRKALTDNKDLFPDLTAAPKQRVMIERADGIKFPINVMLPAGWKPGGPKPPAIFWLYPREFENQDAIDRPDRTFNKNAFQTFGTRSMQFFVRLGYAVIVDTPGALPIVGPANQQNNNYVNDLRNSLSAMIDELDRRGLADRTRLAIGGHSYGAFTTVNAMVHTPFFKAGIAGDGAYNRTLTPMGFQSERRDLWEAPNVYLGMSPFLYANNLTGALLMYHNLGDQNVGTDPTNSMRLFHALNGLGKTTALYLYPLEDHGPVAKETLLDLWARWAAWLDKYVKNPEPKKEPEKK